MRRALELDPAHATARRDLGRVLLLRGDTDEALELLEGAPGDFVAQAWRHEHGLRAIRASARLRGLGRGEPATALELLQHALAEAEPDERDQIRQVMVAIFTELGPDHPLSREHRRRLSSALN